MRPDPDYPAAHSMDTTWFAVDRDGQRRLPHVMGVAQYRRPPASSRARVTASSKSSARPRNTAPRLSTDSTAC